MVIAVDVGTSSVRATVFDDRGEIVAARFHQVACEPRVVAGGGVEHDPRQLLDAVVACLDAVQPHPAPAHRGAPLQIAAVVITTFWHGLCGFGPDGRPITPIYGWADTRSAGEADLLRAALDEPAFHARTGCHFHSSYWPSKLRWLARESPTEFRRVAHWGSMAEVLEQAFFGQARTSISLASGTGLFDQARADWDTESLAVAGIERHHLFPLADIDEVRHDLRPPFSSHWPALRSAAWLPAVADGAASNIGSGCIDRTRIALNLGTSAAMRIVTAPGAPAPRGLWRYRLDRRRALIGGATSEGGNVWAWCRETLRLPDDDGAIEGALAAYAPGGLVALPFLAGERAPGWRGNKRAALARLSLDTTALDITAAMLDAVALRLALIYELLAPCAAADAPIIASGGGIARSRAWTQMIADAIGRPVIRSDITEATSRGAALLALEVLGAGELSGRTVPSGETLVPDAARHARAREALAQQRALDDRL